MRHAMFTAALCALVIGLGHFTGAAGAASLRMATAQEKLLQGLINAHVAKVAPLSKAMNLAYWQSSITGKTEDYDKLNALQLSVNQVYSNSAEYAQLKTLKDSGEVRDPRLARQLDLLINLYLPNQIDPALNKKIVELGNSITQRFHTFRATMDGTTITINQIDTILTGDNDSHRRELAWRASKQVGDAIVGDLRQLARLRNEGARKLGFDNFHTMSLKAGEQDPAEIERIFAQLYELTKVPYARAKAGLDATLAKRYNVAPEALMPWHYHDPFFQRAPLVFGPDLDQYYKTHDVRQLTERFYDGIGLPAGDILARSDLYEKPGKDQHGFEIDIDRQGDVRVLVNIKNDERWMETVLHETGHGLYNKYVDPSVPYLMRDAAHPFCTEATAMFFGRLSHNVWWMQKMLDLTPAQDAEIMKVSGKYLQLQQLIFARWAMVMYFFEKQLYANPGQDLNKLWWDLVEKYQLLKRPAGPLDAGWASKLHFVVAPCYYHNYMLGEMLASQWHHYLVHTVMNLASDEGVSYVGDKRVGDYFRARVFAVGELYPWNEMIRRATGEELTPKYFVEQFVK